MRPYVSPWRIDLRSWFMPLRHVTGQGRDAYLYGCRRDRWRLPRKGKAASRLLCSISSGHFTRPEKRDPSSRRRKRRGEMRRDDHRTTRKVTSTSHSNCDDALYRGKRRGISEVRSIRSFWSRDCETRTSENFAN